MTSPSGSRAHDASRTEHDHLRPVTSPTQAILFLGLELLFMLGAHALGGPPWAVLGAVALVVQAFTRPQSARLLLLTPALAWLGLFQATGNRELFFPYAMSAAAFASLPLARQTWWRGALGGGLVVVAFLVVRLFQQASGRVLAIELVVAGAILAAVLLVARRTQDRIASDAAIVAGASLLAYAGLLL